eukprot:TRINITY_DN1408_c0_g1_i3.p1 TRINITY_DN1408_c0_g1~~TRINITY_DN1408_c0_g1_i3.p1  ORF type:complete len:395 (+),score=88.38 TRINITY_DN1408_c0_g1_i3:64-1185(+)
MSTRKKAAPAADPNFQDLWTQALEHKKNPAQANTEDGQDGEGEKKEGGAIASDVYHSHVIFVGASSAGKTTLLGKLQGKDDKVKPTPVLEYVYIRRKDRYTDAVKAVAHLWELGGGTQLSDLVKFPLNQEAVSTATIVLVLDLSKPQNCLAIAQFWFSTIQKICQNIQKDYPGTKVNDADAKAWHNHSDRDSTVDLGIPVVVIGSKFDKFDEKEAGERKIFCRALRYLCHTYRASLMFVSAASESQSMHFRKLMNRYALQAPSFSKAPNVNDHLKPMIIASGQDSFLSIGEAPTVQGAPAGANDSEKWAAAVENYFGKPDEEALQTSKQDDPEWEKGFPAEAEIDAMRALKDEELEKYRAQSRKNAKEAAAAV